MDNFFKHYVRLNEEGVFGKVSAYFGLVETNERGELHLHGMLWLHSNIDLPTLHHDVLQPGQEDYKRRVTEWVDDLFCEDIRSDNDLFADLKTWEDLHANMKMPGWLEDNFTDLANHQALYSQKHVCTPTCVKYAIQNRLADSKPPSCRFRFPRSLHSSNNFNKNGDLHIKRSHAFLNRYNPPIAVGRRHNDDWTFLNSTSQCLSTIYYTTNYGTKLHTPMYKRLALASTLLEQIPQNQTPDNTDPLEPQPPSHSTSCQCFMRWANKIFTDVEKSVVEVCYDILGFE
ncbi:hypothetical protein DFS34DRAFT_710660 [Phlyctochytrium arcticum]|nr:hypothetical protein DFS34DRAFT_710660 [Phlyctochytrium arcticum]